MFRLIKLQQKKDVTENVRKRVRNADKKTEKQEYFGELGGRVVFEES